jgi:hypothetical protein
MSSFYYACFRITICVRILLIPRQRSQILHLTVLILIIFLFSYCYVCALNNECFCGYFGFSGATILMLYAFSVSICLILLYIYRSHTTLYVSSDNYISTGLILLYTCPHTTRYVAASYCYICQWERRRAAGRARCFTGSSSCHPVLARDAEWAAVAVRESGAARMLCRYCQPSVHTGCVLTVV